MGAINMGNAVNQYELDLSIFTPIVTYALSSNTLTVTEASTMPNADWVFDNIDIKVTDVTGKYAVGQITALAGTATIDVSGLNKTAYLPAGQMALTAEITYAIKNTNTSSVNYLRKIVNIGDATNIQGSASGNIGNYRTTATGN